MHVYQMRSSNAAIVTATEQRLHTCMNALKEVAKVWLVAKMVHTLFESILGNKQLEERLQKAAGRRHQRNKSTAHKGAGHVQPASHQSQLEPIQDASASKRKFDEVDMGFNNGPPSAQMSYERSRPQTPALTPNRDLAPQNQQMPTMAPPGNSSNTSPKMPRSDAFMGNATTGTRQTTPQFQSQPQQRSSFVPSTPPDLFLVTRNSPTISQDLWNNFQPDQLFPADSSISMSNLSPGSSGVGGNYIDPQLAQTLQPTNPTPQLSAPPKPDQQHQHQQAFAYQNHPPLTHRNSQQNGLTHHQLSPSDISRQPPVTPTHDTSNWAQMQALGHQQPQQQHMRTSDDGWSTSSMGASASGSGPAVPTTLNVEDWFQFFGINGDLNGMRAF